MNAKPPVIQKPAIEPLGASGIASSRQQEKGCGGQYGQKYTDDSQPDKEGTGYNEYRFNPVAGSYFPLLGGAVDMFNFHFHKNIPQLSRMLFLWLKFKAEIQCTG